MYNVLCINLCIMYKLRVTNIKVLRIYTYVRTYTSFEKQNWNKIAKISYDIQLHMVDLF